MTVCKTCNGLGKIKLMPFGYICTCAECKGTGETRDYMTNEEWFCGLSTEEKADALTHKIMDIICWNNDPKPSEVYITIKNWLKREHE